MNKVSGWSMFAAFVACFVVFAITHLLIISVAGDIFLVIAVVAGIRNHLRSRHETTN